MQSLTRFKHQPQIKEETREREPQVLLLAGLLSAPKPTILLSGIRRVWKNLKEAESLVNVNENTFVEKCSKSDTFTAGRTLLQYIFNLHRLLRHGVRDRDELVCVIQKACSMAWATISTICRSCLLPGPAKAAQPVTTTDDIDAIFVALSRIIQILLRGYELVLGGREAQADSHSNEHGATAHSIISLFQAILTELSSCIAQIAPSKSSQPATTTTAPKPRSRRAKTSTGIVGTQNLARDLPTHLARLLHSFLAPSTPPSPATVTPPHADLHEGFLGLLLTQAGALLYTTTFATGPRAPCVPAEIAASSIYRVRGPSPPSSATNSTNNAAAANAAADDPDAAKRGAVAQAKYILPLLERLLARTRTRTRARDVDAQMVKVQNTLVRGVFGEDDGGAFGDVMRVPLQVEVAASMGRTEDAAEDEDDDGVEGDGRRAEQDAEWFLARMWEVCGWDVLARTTI